MTEKANGCWRKRASLAAVHLNLLIARTTCPRLFPLINHCALSRRARCPSSVRPSPRSVCPHHHAERPSALVLSPDYRCRTCVSKTGLASTALIPTLRTTRGPSRRHFSFCAAVLLHDDILRTHTLGHTLIFARALHPAAIALARAQHVPSRDHHCRQLG